MERKRDRLIEIIQKSVGGCARNWAEIIADGLLADGWIRPPCKVGDFVYVIYGREIQPTKVFSMKIESEDDHYIFYFKCMVHHGGNRFEKFVYGKTVFLTKEEAQAELERRKK